MFLGVKSLDLDSVVVNGKNLDSVQDSSLENPCLKHCASWMALAHLANCRAKAFSVFNARGSLCSRKVYTVDYRSLHEITHQGVTLYIIKPQGVSTDSPLQNQVSILRAPGSWAFGILKMPPAFLIFLP
jgi:hypothetical protein